MRDPIFNGIARESIVDYLIDFIEIIGAPSLFEKQISAVLPIADYRSKLPDGFIEEISVAINKDESLGVNRDYKIARSNPDTHAIFQKEIDGVMGEQLLKNSIEVTYRISGDYIYFPVETGSLILVYKSIKIDTNGDSDTLGLPMMPDDPVFILALQSYIEVQ